MTVPVGTIILWANANIPANWQICDGTNGTPDLRNKFVMGCSNDNDLLDTGGSTTHVHTTTNNTGSRGYHSHSGNVLVPYSSSHNYASNVGASILVANRHSHYINLSSSTEDSHTHSVQDTKTANHLPPYIKLVFIMRIA